MIEVLPAPVGPVMANRSRAEKSIATRSRKLVNPSISRLIGRIDFLLVQLRKEGGYLLRRIAFVAVPVEGSKQCVRVGSRHADRFDCFRVWHINSRRRAARHR